MPSVWQRFKASFFPANVSTYAAAPTIKVRQEGLAGRASPPPGYDEKKIVVTEESTQAERTTRRKPNAFDKVTKLAGSSVVVFVMLGILVLWLVMGLVYGTTDTWQIILQNASSIQVYVTDILLIRQASNANQSLMITIAELQSRNQTCERLLAMIPGCQWMETHKEEPKKLLLNGRPIEDEVEESLFMVTGRQSRIRTAWNKTCHTIAIGVGSLYAFIIYWIGICVWIAIGPAYQFSDTWQLYINTATALSLTITSVFLQNIQQQQEDKLEKCLEYALKIDAEVEYKLRELTEDEKPNLIFEIAAPKRNRSERAITRFAETMGSGLGVLISLAATAAWIAIGPLLEFNDNWWLIIGTFTGLVGFIDGFVLRNLYHRDEKYAKTQFRFLELSDMKLLEKLNVPPPNRPRDQRSLSTRISIAVGDACGHRFTSIGAVFIVVALLVIATILRWSETGQLLCNTPTMIAEGFLLLVLIQAHNIANVERGEDFNGVLKRRLMLNSYVHAIDA
ncbi:low affinity iron transporter-like protein [Mollisia scopiformis]|uniref:Low affinity iron transporter-like protein n=1 Tax=Mollisia scopiformis TaxID=149040 RepID=A0A194XB32_MOLSC|nr:low affinity iron transporter-like protein [Mollisia scopiformis]KUJ16962.1 low affinity iron transporter-like protein [Mollisia scopiformis]